MNDNPVAWIIGALTAIASLLGAYKVYRDSSKANVVDGFDKLVARMEARLTALETELSRAQTRITVLESQGDVDQAEIQELRRYIGYLQGFIGEHTPPGITPRAMPDSRRDH